MFVLPPPPRYIPPAQAGPPLEPNNLLAHPSGPEYQFVAGEGTYLLRDDLLLATPPPHPSEIPVLNPNPLQTSIEPPTSGVKASFAILAPKHPSFPRTFRSQTPTSSASAISSQDRDGSQPDDGRNSNEEYGLGDLDQSQVAVFGLSNPALHAVNGKDSKDASKRRKPKNNMVKSNSSFVSRVIPDANLPKRLQEHDPAGIYMISNVNRAIQWIDLSSPTKTENLTKILFTKAHALCHDINAVTRSSAHLDVILGFSTSDIIWYEPISQKYSRLNKNGAINSSAVSDIQWMPGSDNLFLAAYMDGTIVIYDKEKEDAPFVPEDGLETIHINGRTTPVLHVRKSYQSRNQKTNPVAFWKLSNQKINAVSFSPDGRHLAVVSEDGCLRILDIHSERLLDQYQSYYGALMCVCWSPDGRYVLTGGQDDLVSIWSLEDCALVARCQGHSSWVTSVAFDPWRCDARNYRFGSVGEDSKLLFWDFSVGMLPRPRAASVRQRGSIVSAMVNGGTGRPSIVGTSIKGGRSSAAGSRSRATSDATRLRSSVAFKSDEDLQHFTTNEDDEEIVHPVEPRARTAVLPPVMAKVIDDHPLSWLRFEEDAIYTACRDGHIRTWDRPKEGTQSAQTPRTSGSAQ